MLADWKWRLARRSSSVTLAVQARDKWTEQQNQRGRVAILQPARRFLRLRIMLLDAPGVLGNSPVWVLRRSYFGHITAATRRESISVSTDGATFTVSY